MNMSLNSPMLHLRATSAVRCRTTTYVAAVVFSGSFLLGLAPRRSIGDETSPEAAEADQEKPAAAIVDAKQIAEWIAQLEDDRYAIRESAQRQLQAAGATAVKAVGQAAADGSLERSTRATNLLLDWSNSDDAELRMGALEQIAALPNRPSEAAAASAILADVREEAALKKIVALGAECRGNLQQLNIPGYRQPIQIVIGPKWKGGVEGLQHLREFRRDITLSFHAAPIGEAAIAPLEKLERVRRIEFYGTDVSAESIAKLKEKLPQNVTIDVRSGARLGIAGGNILGAGGAGVDNVLENSPASKAGIKRGDVVTEIGGTAVTDFVQLTHEISKSKPGDSVKMKVLREGKAPPIEVTVTFDRWGDEPIVVAPQPGQVQLPQGVLVPAPQQQQVIIQPRR